MSAKTLMQWSGVGGLVAGILIAVLNGIQGVLLTSMSFGQAAATPGWIALQTLLLLADALLLLGLVGLYVFQSGESGIVGLVGFLAAFAGTVLVAGAIWLQAFMVPIVAQATPEFLEADPTGSLYVGFVASFVVYVVGWLLFGLASLRARRVPRWASLLTMAGAVLIFVGLGAEIDFPVGSVVFGLGVAGMSRALWL